MACSIPLPLAGSRSKRIQSGCSGLGGARGPHVQGQHRHLRQPASESPSARCAARCRFVVRVGVSTTGQPALPCRGSGGTTDGVSIPWFQCSSVSGRSAERAAASARPPLRSIGHESGFGEAVARIEQPSGFVNLTLAGATGESADSSLMSSRFWPSAFRGVSRTHSSGLLSVAQPQERRMARASLSDVHSVNATCATSRGFTQCASFRRGAPLTTGFSIASFVRNCFELPAHPPRSRCRPCRRSAASPSVGHGHQQRPDVAVGWRFGCAADDGQLLLLDGLHFSHSFERPARSASRAAWRSSPPIPPRPRAASASSPVMSSGCATRMPGGALPSILQNLAALFERTLAQVLAVEPEEVEDDHRSLPWPCCRS